MTFLEAALDILKREGKPLHFKELTERAMTKKLLTFVGRTPEVTMQTQLTAAIKKAPGNPFVRVKPGTFGLLRYPEVPPEEVASRTDVPAAAVTGGASPVAKSTADKSSARGAGANRSRDEKPADESDAERGRRRRRRGGRGTRTAKEGEGQGDAGSAVAAAAPKDARGGRGPDARGKAALEEGADAPQHARDDAAADGAHREGSPEHPDEHMEDPSVGGLSAEARAAALAETGVLEGDDQGHDEDEESDDEADDRNFAAGESSEARRREPGRGGETDSVEEEGDEQGQGERHGDDDEAAAPGASAADGRATSARALRSTTTPVAAAAGDEAEAEDDAGDDEEDEPDQLSFGERPASTEGASADAGDDPARKRRRRRRRRRGTNGDGAVGGDERSPSGVDAAGTATSPSGDSRPSVAPSFTADESDDGSLALGGSPGLAQSAHGGANAGATVNGGAAPGSADASSADTNGQSPARKILAPIDAAIEVLRGQPPGRGVHVRQIADSAIRKRLIHGEPNEAWRVIRTALATEPKHRLRNGTRPRVRSAGSGLFALARRPPDAELEKAEHVFGEARRALRERTMAALEKRLAELPPGAFEALARVLLQREGFGPTTFVKRVDGTIYVEALRGRGSRPSRCLIALRAGAATAGRRAIGELRAGIRARSQDEGILMLCGRLADDGISEWKQPGPPLEIVDGAALAETCARHGVGVQCATVNVDFVDGDFFAELSEG